MEIQENSSARSDYDRNWFREDNMGVSGINVVTKEDLHG